MKYALDEIVPNLPLARLRFVLESKRRAELPILIGSTLRGAFGYQWRAVACEKPAGERGACLVRKYCADPDECRYARLFESSSGNKSVPTPYVFRPPTAKMTRSLSEAIGAGHDCIDIMPGDSVFFDVVLIGDAIDEYEPVGRAIELMARTGLGGQRSQFEVTGVFAYHPDGGAAEIFRSADTPYGECPEFSLHDYVRLRLANMEPADVRHVVFHTPVRFRRRDESGREYLVRDATIGDVVEQSLRRIKLLARIYDEPFGHETEWLLDDAAARGSSAELWSHGSSRRTNRQDRKLRLDGMLGVISFESHADDPLLPCLIAGELLHVGSNCNLGYGMYDLR